MWSSGVISTPTARIIASEIRKKKNLAYHVMSLRMSMVSKNVLEQSDLLDALESHVSHPGIGLSIRELLDRLLNIFEGKEDRINQLFEAKNGVSPFRQPKTRKISSETRIKIRFGGQEEKNEPNASEDSEDTESDYSDTDSETEWPLQKSLIEARRQEEEKEMETEMDEEREIEEIPEIKREEETIRNRKLEDEVEETTVKLPKMEAPSPAKAPIPPSAPLPDADPSTNEKELNLAVKELLHLIKSDLNGKWMEEEGKKPKILEKKAEKRPILIDAPPQTLKKAKKERREEKKKEKPLKTGETKEEKSFSKKLLAERSGNIQNSAEIKPLATVKQKKIEEMTTKMDPAMGLAEKLNELPLVPSRDQVLPLITDLTSPILAAAERIVGRKMRRVDWLWWELIFRDFGPIDRKNCAGDVRDIYAAKKLFAEKKKKREMVEKSQLSEAISNQLTVQGFQKVLHTLEQTVEKLEQSKIIRNMIFQERHKKKFTNLHSRLEIPKIATVQSDL